MKKKLVFGHKNPDTDSICSAIAYADFKAKMGENVEPVRLGSINSETQYALDYFKVQPPRLIEKVDEDVHEVILVDHNEFQQSVDNIREVRIAEVIDHHKIANFETEEPLYFRAEPVGCTATIIYKIYKENNITVPKDIAGLLLSAINSDLLLLKSPTCTKEDIVAANELAKLAEVDMDTYGLAMLKAGANISKKTIAELLSVDSKEFTMGGKNVEIAQVNVIEIAELFDRQVEIEAEINKAIEEKELELFVLVVTDIINSNSEILALGNAQGNVQQAFEVELANNRAFLPGVVSRKKQIVNKLTNTFVVHV